jgi:hypothetical protein
MTLARERSDEETDEREIERRRRAERKRHQNSTESSLVLKNEANAPIQQLFEDIVTPADGPRKLEDAIATISRDRVHFIRTSSGSEGEHLALWIRAASDQPFLKRGPQQPHRDPMTQIATAFFERHRFNVGKAVSYRFQGAIVGPRLAGKTTLLSNAFYQFLLELATSGCWKHFFTFGLDLKMLEPKFGNLVDLYHTLLEEVMQACKRQQPVLAEHMIAIRKQLLSVTENRPPLSGLHPYRRVDRIARDLNTAWRNPNGLGDFLTAVFTLPATLPRAFGFKLLAFFVDNIEYGDRPISPSAPFDSAGGFCFPVEHFKQALAQASFLISSESVNSLYHVLAPLEERNVDLRPGLDVITLFEATQDLGSRTRYDYLVEVQGDQIPIRISVDMCGGIPTYLTAWDELNHTLFQLERTPESEARFNERFYEAIADAQRLVDLLFVDLNDKGIIVTSVIRDRRQRS